MQESQEMIEKEKKPITLLLTRPSRKMILLYCVLGLAVMIAGHSLTIARYKSAISGFGSPKLYTSGFFSIKHVSILAAITLQSTISNMMHLRTHAARF